MKRLLLKYRPNKLASYLNLISSVFITVAVVGLGTFAYFVLSGYAEKEYQTRVNSLSKMAEKAFIQSLWTFDRSLADSIAEALIKGNLDILSVKVLDSEGKIFVEKIGSYDQKEVFQRKAASINFDGSQIGSLEIVFSNSSLEAFANAIKGIVVLAVALLTVSFYFLNRYLMEKFVGQPISQLQEMARSIQNNQEIKNPKGLEFELDLLGKAFFNASHEILKRDKVLEENNRSLETIVQQRTSEVETRSKQLIAQNRLAALGEFSAGVSHEVNNPLAVINGKVSILKKKLQSSAVVYDELKTDLEKIDAMVLRISKIITGLRSFARDGSKEPIHLCDVATVLQDIYEVSQVRLRDKEIEIKLEIDEKVQVPMREVQLSQVIVNLINNSADAIESLPEKWVKISVVNQLDDVLIKVVDSGFGIPLEVREKMFAPFFTTKEAGKGTGIGLSISSGMVADMGGQLSYDSQAKNTTFVISLPKTHMQENT